MPEPAPTAIPFEHLITLGDLTKSDPVIWGRNADGAVGVHGWLGSLLLQDVGPGGSIPVEQSMPALLRCLARQYGAKLEPGEVPRWTAFADGLWVLDCMKSSYYFVPPDYACVAMADAHPVPELTADMNRLESLAAVIAWLVSR